MAVMPDLISVIIPTYQHAEALPACLDSVLAQTYDPIEIIVVNDGSTDNTLEVLDQYKDRIKTINQDNQGSNPARNRGFRESSGDHVIFCDADVVMKSNCLVRMYKALQRDHSASYAYSAFHFGRKLMRGVPFDSATLRKYNYINSASLIRREHFPGFDESIKRFQDWDLFLTMLTQGHVGVMIPEVLYDVRVIGESRIGSAWLPSFVYKLPWNFIGWKPARVRKYEKARNIIAKKHNL